MVSVTLVPSAPFIIATTLDIFFSSFVNGTCIEIVLLSFKDDIMTLESNFLTPIKLTVSDHTYKFCRYENNEKIVNINEYEAEEDIGDFILQGAEIYEEIINKIKEETTNE